MKRIPSILFKSLLQKGVDTNGAVITKWIPNAYTGVCKGEGEDGESGSDRTLSFTLSTPAVDRDNDTIAVRGWSLKEFRRSGVVLWNHNASRPPIAIPRGVQIVGDKLKGSAEFFAPGDLEDSLSADVFTLYKRGALKAVSVGFDPVKFIVNEERSEGSPFRAVDFKKQILLEWSPTPIPANPEALLDKGMMMGVDEVRFRSWVEEDLDSSIAQAQSQCGAPRELAEQTYATLVGNPKSASGTKGDKMIKSEIDLGAKLDQLLDKIDSLADTLSQETPTPDPNPEPPEDLGAEGSGIPDNEFDAISIAVSELQAEITNQ